MVLRAGGQKCLPGVASINCHRDFWACRILGFFFWVGFLCLNNVRAKADLHTTHKLTTPFFLEFPSKLLRVYLTPYFLEFPPKLLLVTTPFFFEFPWKLLWVGHLTPYFLEFPWKIVLVVGGAQIIRLWVHDPSSFFYWFWWIPKDPAPAPGPFLFFFLFFFLFPIFLLISKIFPKKKILLLKRK